MYSEVHICSEHKHTQCAKQHCNTYSVAAKREEGKTNERIHFTLGIETDNKLISNEKKTKLNTMQSMLKVFPFFFFLFSSVKQLSVKLYFKLIISVELLLFWLLSLDCHWRMEQMKIALCVAFFVLFSNSSTNERKRLMNNNCSNAIDWNLNI